MVSSISSSMGSYGMPSLKEMQQKMFQKADADGDGQITKTEFSSMQTTAASQGSSSSDERFTKLDTDGDGTVSRAESDAAIEKMHENKPPGPPPPMASEESSSSSGGSTDSLTQSLLDTLNEGDDSSTSSQNQDSDLAQMIRNAMKSYMQAGFSTSSQNAGSLSVLGSQIYA